MARSSSSSSSDVDENISPNNVKFETDEAKVFASAVFIRTYD